MLNTAPNVTVGGDDYPVWGTGSNQGLLVYRKSGLPYSGVEPSSGKNFQGGREVKPPAGQQFIPGTTTPIDPNNPNQRYQAVNVDKNKPVEQATDSLLQDFKKTAGSAVQDFGSYLNDFKSQVGSANASGRAAVGNIGNTAADLQAQQSRYSGSLDNAVSHAAQNNSDVAAREAEILRQEQENNRVGMNNALTASERMQLGQLNQQVSRYKIAGGTPTSMGSDELAMQAAGARQIAIPIELQRVQNAQNILQNTALPIAQQDAARDAQFWQSFVPGVAGTQYQSAQQTTMQIQKLKELAVTLGYDNAMKYMQSIGVPTQIQQQILSGQIGNLGGLNQLYSGSRYQGLQDVLGANVSQPANYSVQTGGLPQPRYPDIGIPQTDLGQPNAPVTYNANPNAGVGPGGYPITPGNPNGVRPGTVYGYTPSASRYGMTPGAGQEMPDTQF